MKILPQIFCKTKAKMNSPKNSQPPKVPKDKRKKKDEKSASWMSTPLARILGLVSLIPIFMAIPFVFTYVTEKIYANREILWGVWAVYIAILAGIFFYWRKNTLTLNSFSTQILIWATFTSAIYAFIDLPKLLPLHLRPLTLQMWGTLTMVLNIIYFFIDDTDYIKAERKEAKREAKAAEKWKKYDEVYNRDFEKQVSPRTRQILNLLVYTGALFLIYALYQFYSGVKARRDAIYFPPKEPEYEPNFD
jgi:hypothetical protein